MKTKKIRIKLKRKVLTEDSVAELFKPATYPFDFSPKEQVKLLFLQRFLRYRVASQACQAVAISRQTLNNWRNKDRKFEEAYQTVEEAITEELESAGLSRAVRDSDDLIKFFLKARNRKKYGDKLDHSLEGAFSLRDFYSHQVKRTADDGEGSPGEDKE